MTKYKTKIFLGTTNIQADEKFNEWVKDKDIEIIKFKYQQARYGDHSIAVLYIDKEEGVLQNDK